MKIAVGGMISSGKSTLVRELAEELNIPAMDEFDGSDEVFNTLLKWLYEGKPNVEMLLQVYFLHNHWIEQKKHGDNVIVDRHIIEHWLFAQTNLEKHKDVLNMYNGLFHAYMNTVEHPDLYLILDVNWDNFERRIMNRGREQEIENFGNNIDYFENLMKDYVIKLKAQCDIYNIPYVVIDTNDMLPEEVVAGALSIVDYWQKRLENEKREVEGADTL